MPAGRPKGSANQTTVETRDWARKLKDKHNVDSVVSQTMKEGSLSEKIAVWKLLTEYERGLPIRQVGGEGGRPMKLVVESYIECPDRSQN